MNHNFFSTRIVFAGAFSWYIWYIIHDLNFIFLKPKIGRKTIAEGLI